MKKDKQRTKESSSKDKMETANANTTTATVTANNINNGSTENTESQFKSIILDLDEDCPITNVTIHHDRAEVTRMITKQINQSGTYELKMRNLPSIIDRNSVHVSGGNASVSIVEVSTEFIYSDSTNGPTVIEKKKTDITELERQIKMEERNLATVKKSMEWLETWSKSIIRSSPSMNSSSTTSSTLTSNDSSPTSSFVSPIISPRSEPTMIEPFAPEKLKQVSNFLEFYEQEINKLDKRIFSQEELLTKLRNQQKILTEELNQMSPSTSQQAKSLEVTILVQIAIETSLKLSLIYVLSHASWSPSYDLRAQNNSNEAVLTYYGSITNMTGEDWKDVQVCLSTAMPTIGGNPPDLKPLRVETDKSIALLGSTSPRKPKAKKIELKKKAKSLSKIPAPPNVAENVHEEEEEEEEEKSSHTGSEGKLPTTNTTAISDGLFNETFQIQRRAKILSGGKAHKVTIGVITLTDIRQVHVSVPKLTPNVYLKASAVNSSTYRFIPGPMEVFFDSNFVATSSMKNVQPRETFSFFLGVDGGVKVEYSPQVHKKKEEGGGWLLGKTKMEKVEKKILVKNTKDREISFLLIDQLPIPSEDKVKITLIQPESKRVEKVEKVEKTEGEQTGTVKMNPQNCLEWRIRVSAGETVTIPFEYHIEWPADTNIYLLED